jgi:hypothetical protein
VRGIALPSESSIGRYLHQWTRFRRRPKEKLWRKRPKEPTQVHQRWQIDFKMGIALKDESLINLHTVRDPVGEACLGAFISRAGKGGQKAKKVTLEQVRGGLRACFARWGILPDEIQITIGGRHKCHTVGRAYSRHQVLVRFDPNDRHLAFFDINQPEKEIGR